MKIAILGYAGQGKSAYEYWNQNDNEVVISDRDPGIDIPKGAEARLGDDHLKHLDEFDLLVRTPILHPRKIQAANPEAPDILDKVTSVTNEFLRVCPSKNIIGVTGTKGKGTTSTMIAHMLHAAGKRTHLGGNIGIPPLDLLNGAGYLHRGVKQDDGKARTEAHQRYGEGGLQPPTRQSTPRDSGISSSVREQAHAAEAILPDDWVVLELANFQLIDLKSSPRIAVCLMVVPEHLDWHTDMEEYLAAKRQLFTYQTPEDIAVYFAEDPNSKRIAAAGKGKKVPYFQIPGAVIKNGAVCIDTQVVCAIDELKLIGEHNWQNVCAAVTAVWQITQDIPAIRSVLTSFSGLEHRLEFVREHEGVQYYNDSFGTTPETAIAAINAFTEPKVIILGGSDKGASFDNLADTVARSTVRGVIVIGETAPKITAALKDRGFSNITAGGTTMPEIVRQAKALSRPGDVVLLSTGCASFGLFDNYKDRGDQFKQAVQSLASAA